MPDTPASSSSSSGFMGTLKSKWGPLPVWGWLALITALMLGYWLYTRNKQGSQAQQPQTGQPGVVVINQGDTTTGDTDQTTGPPPKKKKKDDDDTGKGDGGDHGDKDGGKHKRRRRHHQPDAAVGLTPPAPAESKNGATPPTTVNGGGGGLPWIPQPFPVPDTGGGGDVDMTGIGPPGA